MQRTLPGRLGIAVDPGKCDQRGEPVCGAPSTYTVPPRSSITRIGSAPMKQ
jgi:hypothetical protein